MQLESSDKDNIKKSIEKLNNLIDSGALGEMNEGADENKEILESLPGKRNELVVALMDILASELSQNNSKFKSILDEMKKINKAADEAADELKEIADRIESAVKVAKTIDKVLQLAAQAMI